MAKWDYFIYVVYHWLRNQFSDFKDTAIKPMCKGITHHPDSYHFLKGGSQIQPFHVICIKPGMLHAIEKTCIKEKISETNKTSKL